ncbi:hypothetical protein [Rhizohabitans arisaemae]|uniref:hypothetical protein n=1 Tax=Rhizohabitans arisaemae TaxID=2720610 RepID=UPI0024B0F949|nr:hypothetical protein [Rhizohabitans arisaemae]
MTIRIDDLDDAAAFELTDDALDTVIGGRPGMEPATGKYCTSINNGQPDSCRDVS